MLRGTSSKFEPVAARGCSDKEAVTDAHHVCKSTNIIAMVKADFEPGIMHLNYYGTSATFETLREITCEMRQTCHGQRRGSKMTHGIILT